MLNRHIIGIVLFSILLAGIGPVGAQSKDTTQPVETEVDPELQQLIEMLVEESDAEFDFDTYL